MAKNKDGGGGREGAIGAGAGGQQPIVTWSARPSRCEHRRGRNGEGGKRGREAEGEAGTAGEGGLPTSDPADGGHMAAASQIKRLRLGGSAITAV